VAKGMSKKFDGHESDTARRGYAEEVVDPTKRTAKMSPFELEGLRHESGTRRAFSEASDYATEPIAPPSADGVEIEVEVDSQPTIQQRESTPSRQRPHTPEVDGSRSPTRETATPSPSAALPPGRTSVAGSVVALLVLAVLILVAAAGATGYVLGHRSVIR